MAIENPNSSLLHDEALKQAFPEKFFSDPTGIDRYVVQEKQLYAWESPTKLSAPSLPKIGAGLVLAGVGIGLVLFVTGDLIFVPLMLAMAAAYTVLVNRPLSHLKCQVTTLGVKINDKYYYWSQLTQYWFENRQDSTVLMVRCIYPTYTVLKLIVVDDELEPLMTTLGTYLLYKKPQDTWQKKSAEFLRKMLPFDVDFL